MVLGAYLSGQDIVPRLHGGYSDSGFMNQAIYQGDYSHAHTAKRGTGGLLPHL